MAYAKGSGTKDASYAKGGGVLGRTRDFLKEPNQFTTDKGVDQDYSKTGTAGKLAKTSGDKCL